MDKTQTFNARKEAITELMKKLEQEAARLCNRNPEKLNWAEVADMGRLEKYLREIVENK